MPATVLPTSSDVFRRRGWRAREVGEGRCMRYVTGVRKTRCYQVGGLIS